VPSVQLRKADQTNGHAMGATQSRGLNYYYYLVATMCTSCTRAYSFSVPFRWNGDVSPRGISWRSPKSLALELWYLPIQAPRELYPAARGRDSVALPRWVHCDM
jgi:hypothetical protein